MSASGDIAVRVEHVSKQFRLGRRQSEYPTLRDAIASGVRRAARQVGALTRTGTALAHEGELLLALDDVSLDVRQGETLGIIGANGAGKSTLLKILARVTEPTSGRAEVHGRLGSLLEVGTGFHQELSGRENIFLNGAILGMKRLEIRRRFDEIVDFAEVERFIDTPVKFYSSGMYLRLAFAVAAHLEPEILLVDEVLAVGDAAFQEKCLGKMGDVARQGRTILFVSHNLIAMEGLCDRLVWLQGGRVVVDGPASDVVARYARSFATSMTEQRWDGSAGGAGNEQVRMHAARVRPRDGSVGDPITVTTPLVLEFEYRPSATAPRLVPTIHLVNRQGLVVFKATPSNPAPWQRPADAGALVRDVCHLPGGLLNDGVHRVAFSLTADYDVVFWLDDVLIFDVRDTVEMRNAWYGKWPGVVRPMLDWHSETLEPDAADPVRP